MKNLKILIVEGNLQSENINFKKAGIQTHTESLKDSIANYHKEVSYEVLNPSSAENFNDVINKLETYDGIVWGGSSLNIYNDTPEIRKQIFFMKECFHKVRNILAICWGMQVAVTAAGGEVKKAANSHIGIANEIMLSNNGLEHPLYKNKDKKFNSPAFNFDEVVTLPSKGVCLASNKINKIQSLYFNLGDTRIWGLQYHPEITYHKMITLIKFRKDRLINDKKCFKDELEIQNHIKFIEEEIKLSKKDSRMVELRNWLNHLKAA